jgi:hypothetical protein
MSETIRVIMFEEGGLWVAQCLEHDIAAQAENVDTLHARLNATLKAEYNESMERHGKPFAGIDPAPERFQRMWNQRAQSFDIVNPPFVFDDGRMKVDLALVA